MPPKDVFAAAITNKAFKQKLLDPTTRRSALQDGYMGQSFELTNDETEAFISIGRVKGLRTCTKIYWISPHP